MRPLDWLAQAHEAIDVDEEIDGDEGMTFDEAMVVAMHNMLEGMLEIEVDDECITRQNADDLFVECITILDANRETEWSNPSGD